MDAGNEYIVALESLPGDNLRIVGGMHGVLTVHDDCLATRFGAWGTLEDLLSLLD